MLEFAITFKPDMPHQRIIALTRQAEAAGFAYALDIRLARPVAGALSADDADGGKHRADATRHLRDQSGGSRRDGDGEPACDAQSNLRRADGPWHRTRRQLAARDGQEADDARAPGGDRAGHRGSKRRQADRIRRPRDSNAVGGFGRAAGVGRGIRPKGAALRRDESATG